MTDHPQMPDPTRPHRTKAAKLSRREREAIRDRRRRLCRFDYLDELREIGVELDDQFRRPAVGERVRHGLLASTEPDGPVGAFILPGSGRRLLLCVADLWDGYEHVAVGLLDSEGNPRIRELERVKAAFWGWDSTIIQVYPPRGDDKHADPFHGFIHLWRPTDQEIEWPAINYEM